MECRGRVGCATYTLHFWTLGGGGCLLAAEAPASADGLPLWLWVAWIPVSVGFDVVALAGAVEWLVGKAIV